MRWAVNWPSEDEEDMRACEAGHVKLVSEG